MREVDLNECANITRFTHSSLQSMLKDEEVWQVPGGWEGSRRRRDGGDSRRGRRGRSREKLEVIQNLYGSDFEL